MTLKNKPHGNVGNANAAKRATKSDHLHIRIDPMVKALAMTSAAREQLTLSEYISVLICTDKE